jgi:hypothetical protein
MTTTLDLPDELLNEAQREALGRGQSLQSFVAEAIRSRLHATPETGGAAGIMDFAGIFQSSREESLRIMRTISEGCEQVRPDDWR